MKSKKAICFTIVFVMIAALCPVAGVYAADDLANYITLSKEAMNKDGSTQHGLYISGGAFDVPNDTGILGGVYTLSDRQVTDRGGTRFELYYTGTPITLGAALTGSGIDTDAFRFYYRNTDADYDAPAKATASAVADFSGYLATSYGAVISSLTSGTNLYLVKVNANKTDIDFVAPIWVVKVAAVAMQAGSGGDIKISTTCSHNPGNVLTDASIASKGGKYVLLLDAGDTFEITVSPNNNHRIDTLTHNGNPASWQSSATFTSGSLTAGSTDSIYATFASTAPPPPPRNGDRPHAPSIVPTAPSGSGPEQPVEPPPSVFASPLTTESISLVTTFGQSTAVIDGETKAFPKDYGSPYLSGSGNTMLPLRLFSESMGFGIEWNNAARKITITDADGNTCVLYPGQPYVYDEAGKAFGTLLDSAGNLVSPMINSDDRTYLPMRAILEQIFGVPKDKIVYDGTAQTVTVLE